jgi:hypothetical protein
MGHVSQIDFDGAAALASAMLALAGAPFRDGVAKSRADANTPTVRSPYGVTSVGSLLHADAPPRVTQEGEMIEFLAQMPTDTMIFLTMAVLGLARLI